ncbi:MAG: universal stress protein [Planctomycetaceae bacterium]
MSFSRRIVVGIEMPKSRPWSSANLCGPSRMAVFHAFQAAGSSRLPLTLVTVLPTPSGSWLKKPEDLERVAASDRAEAEAVLKELCRKYTAEAAASNAEIKIMRGSAWEELIRSVGNRPDSMLICGTRDEGTVRRVLFGSTGLKLLRLAPGNVWLVKPREDDNDSTDIIAATDGGSVGADVIITAVPLAKSLNARLHIVHAVEGVDATPEVLQQAEAIVQQQLAGTDFRTLPFGVKVHIKSGSPDQCILDTVREVNADLVVLGTSSKTGVSGLLPGSTVERLLPELPCSVMAIKPEGFRSMLPADFWTH